MGSRRVVTITGVSGVGKSYLVREALRRHWPDGESMPSVLELGTALCRVAPELDLPAMKRSQLSSLAPEHLCEMTARVVERLGAEGRTILISHVAVYNLAYILLSPQNEMLIKPDAYILIEAECDVIHQLRQRDRTRRERVLESATHIVFMQDLTRWLTHRYAQDAGVPFCLIRNRPDDSDGTTKALADALSTYL